MTDKLPPATLSLHAQAIWYDANGNWDNAHALIQDLSDQKAAMVHAYLHRKEGDQHNADYWYNRAVVATPQISLTQEWEKLVQLYL